MGSQQKKDLKEAVLSKIYTYILNYPENFNFIAFGVRTYNYFHVQVHAHSCPYTFNWNVLVLVGQSHVISTKIISCTSKYLNAELTGNFCFAELVCFTIKNVIFIIRIIIILSPYFGGKMLFPLYTLRLPNSLQCSR